MVLLSGTLSIYGVIVAIDSNYRAKTFVCWEKRLIKAWQIYAKWPWSGTSALNLIGLDPILAAVQGEYVLRIPTTTDIFFLQAIFFVYKTANWNVLVFSNGVCFSLQNIKKCVQRDWNLNTRKSRALFYSRVNKFEMFISARVHSEFLVNTLLFISRPQTADLTLFQRVCWFSNHQSWVTRASMFRLLPFIVVVTYL